MQQINEMLVLEINALVQKKRKLKEKYINMSNDGIETRKEMERIERKINLLDTARISVLKAQAL